MSKQSTFPDWIVEGAKVVVVNESMGKPRRVWTTTVEKVNKASFRVAGDDTLFRAFSVSGGDIVRLSSSDPWSGVRTLVFQVGDPRAVKARRDVITAKIKNKVHKAAETFRVDPSGETAVALERAAATYAALVRASDADFETIYRATQEG